jgi:2-oxo-4-hydroxy-4-carboxy-5-ureidoimidazoline decarboxylase
MADLPTAEAVARFDALTQPEARALLERCCGSQRWVEAMLAARPFHSAEALHASARELWAALGPLDYREAFAHHPEIGASLDVLRQKFAATEDLSRAEQAGASEASETTIRALAEYNRIYRERFGYSFIVCATGKSAQEMLELLQTRLDHDPARELAIAAAEQEKITRLRLEKI